MVPTSDDHRALDVFGKGNVTVQGVSISEVDWVSPRAARCAWQARTPRFG